MDKGSIVGSIDFAQVTLYLFWVFFIGLIFYLRREDKREGYPLIVDGSGTVQGPGYPAIPEPKTFLMPHGDPVTVPNFKADPPVTKARPMAPWHGAPLEPTGNPMVDGVGPASYVLRADEPDLTVDGEAKIVPMRVASDFSVEDRDPDPRGMEVVGMDGKVAGKVTDIWIDRSEVIIRYLEVQLSGNKTVLLPWNFCRVDKSRDRINVASIKASQFSDVPGTSKPARITLREEDRICAYYGGGHLYADASRAEPFL